MSVCACVRVSECACACLLPYVHGHTCGLTDNSVDSLAASKKLFSRKQQFWFFWTLLDCKLMSFLWNDAQIKFM